MSRVTLSQVQSSFDALKAHRYKFLRNFEVHSARFLSERLSFSQALDASQEVREPVARFSSAALSAILDSGAPSGGAVKTKPSLADFTSALLSFSQFLQSYEAQNASDEVNYKAFSNDLFKLIESGRFADDVTELVRLIERYPYASSLDEYVQHNFRSGIAHGLFSFFKKVLESYDFSDHAYTDFVRASFEFFVLNLHKNFCVVSEARVFEELSFCKHALKKIIQSTERLSDKLSYLEKCFDAILRIMSSGAIRLGSPGTEKLAEVAAVFSECFFDVFKTAVSEKLPLDDHMGFFKKLIQSAAAFDLSYTNPFYETVTVSFILRKLFQMLSVPDEREAALFLLKAADSKVLLSGFLKLSFSLALITDSLSYVAALYEHRLVDHAMSFEYFSVLRGAIKSFQWSHIERPTSENLPVIHFLSTLIKGEDYLALAKEVVGGLGVLSQAKYKAGDLKAKVLVIQEGLEEAIFKKYFPGVEFEKTVRSSAIYQRVIPRELIQAAAETFVLRLVNPEEEVGEVRLKRILTEAGFELVKQKKIKIPLCQSSDIGTLDMTAGLKQPLMVLAEKNIFQDSIRGRKEAIVLECVAEINKKYREQLQSAYSEAKRCATLELMKPEEYAFQRVRRKVSTVLGQYPLLIEESRQAIFAELCDDSAILKLQKNAFDLQPLLSIVVGTILMSGKGSEVSEPAAAYLVAVLCRKEVGALSSDDLSLATELSQFAFQRVKEIREDNSDLSSSITEDIKRTWMRNCVTQVAYVMGKGLFQSAGSYDADALKACSDQYMEKLETFTGMAVSAEEKTALSAQVCNDAVERLCDEQMIFSA